SPRTDGLQHPTACCEVPSITPNGRFIVFRSDLGDLVPGDTNGVQDVFVHDRDTDADGTFDEAGGILTERVSIRTNGAEGTADSSVDNPPSISDDGRYVTFESDAVLTTGDANV